MGTQWGAMAKRTAKLGRFVRHGLAMVSERRSRRAGSAAGSRRERRNTGQLWSSIVNKSLHSDSSQPFRKLKVLAWLILAATSADILLLPLLPSACACSSTSGPTSDEGDAPMACMCSPIRGFVSMVAGHCLRGEAAGEGRAPAAPTAGPSQCRAAIETQIVVLQGSWQ